MAKSVDLVQIVILEFGIELELYKKDFLKDVVDISFAHVTIAMHGTIYKGKAEQVKEKLLVYIFYVHWLILQRSRLSLLKHGTAWLCASPIGAGRW